MAQESILTPAGALPPALSPDATDVLTELTSILSSLRTPTSGPGNATSTGSGTTPAAAPTPSAPSGNSIPLKDIPAATDHLKHKLQRARQLIKTLPDIHRTITQQEQEMRELEDKIGRQRAQIAALTEKGGSFAAAQTAGSVEAADGDRMEE